MLVRFKVKNYLSFKDETVFSMEATRATKNNETVIKSIAGRLLKSSVVYGANASGKTNLLRAMQFAVDFILYNFKYYDFCDLHSTTEDKGSFFEFELIIDNKIYLYGFIVNKTQVIEEWLLVKTKLNNEFKPLFIRELQDIKVINPKLFKENIDFPTEIKPSCLYLSVLASKNNEISYFIVKSLNKIYVKLNDDDMIIPIIHYNLIKGKRNKIIKMLQAVGIEDADTCTEENVSFGTKKLFCIFDSIISIMENGGILIVDGLESHLHPLIVKFIIDLFNSKQNINNAQLIFTTHNLYILNNKTFRNDQIWFTDKNEDGATDLYSLADFQLPKTCDLAKFYLNGKFGAIPDIKYFAINKSN